MQNKRNQAVKERNNTIQDRDNAIEAKKDTIQEHSNVQELLNSAQLQVERLLQENKTLTSYLPFQKSENQGCLHSQISVVSHFLSQDLNFFRKKLHHKKHWN